jgi:PTH1 family peptidyl-tRNA hydrolase
VTASLGTQEFPRVRIGIDPGQPRSSGIDYVLSRFSRQQKKDLDELVDRSADAVSLIIAEGVDKAMAAHNRRAPGSNKEEA